MIELTFLIHVIVMCSDLTRVASTNEMIAKDYSDCINHYTRGHHVYRKDTGTEASGNRNGREDNRPDSGRDNQGGKRATAQDERR